MDRVINTPTVPRACQEYADMGVTRSGIYLIDPDGAGIGEAAFNVTCDMETGEQCCRCTVYNSAIVTSNSNNMQHICITIFISVHRINNHQSQFNG
jgi:hypothetical protein